MAEHAQDGLQGGVSLGLEVGSDNPTADAAALPGGLRADEVLGLGQGTELRPIARGAENTRATQSFTTLVEYEVPTDHYALLDEVAANIDSNGEVRFSIPGEDTFSLTGSIDVALPYNGAVLAPGSIVRVSHQSTDGNNSTQRGTITAREV